MEKLIGFRERLRMELFYNGMSAKELAYKADVPYSTILQYLSKARSLPNVAIGVKIATALQTTVEYLVTGNDARIIIKQDSRNQTIEALSLLPDPLVKEFDILIRQVGELYDKTGYLQKDRNGQIRNNP